MMRRRMIDFRENPHSGPAPALANPLQKIDSTEELRASTGRIADHTTAHFAGAVRPTT
jgi:hypothetical protein